MTETHLRWGGHCGRKVAGPIARWRRHVQERLKIAWQRVAERSYSCPRLKSRAPRAPRLPRYRRPDWLVRKAEFAGCIVLVSPRPSPTPSCPSHGSPETRPFALPGCDAGPRRRLGNGHEVRESKQRTIRKCRKGGCREMSRRTVNYGTSLWRSEARPYSKTVEVGLVSCTKHVSSSRSGMGVARPSAVRDGSTEEGTREWKRFGEGDRRRPSCWPYALETADGEAIERKTLRGEEDLGWSTSWSDGDGDGGMDVELEMLSGKKSAQMRTRTEDALPVPSRRSPPPSVAEQTSPRRSSPPPARLRSVVQRSTP